MPWGAAIAAVGAIAAGSMEAGAASDAADSQARSSAAQIAEARRQFDLTRSDNEPFRQAGVGAIGAQSGLLGIGGDPAAQQAAFQRWRDSTGYQFGLSESLRGIEQSAAQRGGLYSGAAMKALQDRASQVANQGFGTYFNQLGALAGQGQNANDNNQTASGNFMNAYGSASQNAANARSSAYQQQGQAWGNTLNQLGGIYNYQRNGGFNTGGGGGNTGVPAQGSGTMSSFGGSPSYSSGGAGTFWGY